MLQVYAMTSPVRGRCLILNNEKFKAQRLQKRRGSEMDVRNLIGVFKKLGLEVNVETDLTAEVIHPQLQSRFKP